MKKLLLLIILLLSCDEPALEGCITDTACNYNIDATKNDGSCIEPQGCNDWCEGSPDTTSVALELDCTGECGGDTLIDSCGVCGGDIFVIDDCPQCDEGLELGCDLVCAVNPIVNDECGICGGGGILEGDCDCDGNELDCSDVCGGTDISCLEEDDTPPTVIITSPVSGQTVFEFVTISASPTDNIGIKEVEFIIDDSLHYTDATPQYEYEWNTTVYTDNSEHIIKVIAYDKSNNTAEAQPILLTVDNSNSFPQQVNITSVSYTLSEMTFQLSSINDDDFGSYDLMKGDSNGSNWNPCNYTYNDSVVVQVAEPNSSLTITDFNPLEPTCYWVKVSDIYGLSTEGDKYYVMDDEPTAVTFDEIIYDDNSFNLSWTKNTDDDFHSYTLYESTSEDMSDSTQIFTSDDINSNSYIIDSVEEGIIKYYHIIVEDIWGLKSISNIQMGSPWIKFTKTFSNMGTVYGIQITTDGGYIIVGAGYDSNDNDFLLKTDSQGNEEWSNTNGGYSVQQTSDGGYIITGYYSNYIGLKKLNLAGEQEWFNQELTPSYGYDYSKGYDVKETADGGYIIAGGYRDDGWAPGVTVRLIKTDGSGNQEWTQSYSDWCGNCYNWGRSTEQTSDNGYIVVGYYDGEFGKMVKTDSQGNEEWSNYYGGYDVEITSDGGYLVAGEKLHKINSDGNLEWELESPSSGMFNSVQQTIDGRYIASSRNKIIKVDINGNEEWIRTIGGLNSYSDSFVQQTTDGGYIFVGMFNIPWEDDDVILQKLDAFGN